MASFRILLGLIFAEKFWKKFIAYTTLFLIGYALSDFLALFFITFICAYIFLEVGSSIATKIHNWGEKWKIDTPHKIAKKYATTNTTVTVLYIFFIVAVVLIFMNIVPKIKDDITNLVKEAPGIADKAQDFVNNLEDPLGIDLGLNDLAGNLVSTDNIQYVGKFIFDHLTSAGVILVKFFVGLILSYVFIIERGKVWMFLEKMRDGNFAFFYDEWAVIAKKVWNGFGLVFKAQSLIALINSILTAIGLIIISIIHTDTWWFPYIVTLSLIVLIFGFIPVFGTILSGIPIVIIASGPGWGFSTVIAVIVMITIIHIVEAYYLNPKIVSSYVHFPVFITFLTLIISEHVLGLLGLLIGVPLFSIFIGLIEDMDQYINTIRLQYQKKIASLKT